MAEKGKRRTARKVKGISKVPTGIPGFDQVLQGGLPEGRIMLVVGSSGTGKTVFAHEFLYRGATEYGEPGVFVTFEERPDDIARNVAGFGRDLDSLVRDRQLAFVDFTAGEAEFPTEIGADYDLTPVLLRVERAVERIGARRVVVDSMANLFARFANGRAVRHVFQRLCDRLRDLGVTTVVTAEKAEQGSGFSRYNVEDYVADGVIDLELRYGQQQMTRVMTVRKVRGVYYRSGAVQYEIGADGLQVYPKIPVDRSLAKVDFRRRKRFGIERFDDLLDGGIPEGHVFLISGNTGTGKSSFCMHFMHSGLEAGERCVYLALEEPSGQILNTGLARAWGFRKAQKAGRLTFIDVPLIDIMPDKILYQLVDAIRSTGATRLVVDSISSLESATMDVEDVRQFLSQLTEFCKANGVTAMLTYLTPGAFGAGRGQLLGEMQTTDMRLSSVVDAILLLRYVERGQKVKRLLNILKLRGSRHDNAIYMYTLADHGVVMGEKYED